MCRFLYHFVLHIISSLRIYFISLFQTEIYEKCKQKTLMKP